MQEREQLPEISFFGAGRSSRSFAVSKVPEVEATHFDTGYMPKRKAEEIIGRCAAEDLTRK